MFICDQCGECCKHLMLSPLYKELDRGDGICIYLKENRCSIYSNRPLICRVDDCYEAFFQEQMSRKDYYRLNTEMCNKLKNAKKEI